MRILYFAPRLPNRPFDGGAYTVHHQLVNLRQRGHHVTLCAPNTNRHFADAHLLTDLYDELVTETVETEIRPLDALMALLSRGEPFKTDLPKAPYTIQRFIDDSLWEALVKHLNNSAPYDIIHVDYLAMAWYAFAARKAFPSNTPPIHFRAHNVEYKILEHLQSDKSKPWLARWYYRLLSKQTRRFEEAVAHSADGMSTVAEPDSAFFRNVTAASVKTILPGMDIPEAPVNLSRKNNTFHIGFLGSLEWMPNVEGLLWFVKRVFPKILDVRGDVQLHIAGRNPVTDVLNLNNGSSVIVHGEVEDARDFLETLDLAISPVLSGSGVRIKILEGLANGLPMVSTTLGADGIDVENGKHILLADSPDEFSKACLDLLTRPEFAAELAANGRQLIEEGHTWKASIDSIIESYLSIISIR